MTAQPRQRYKFRRTWTGALVDEWGNRGRILSPGVLQIQSGEEVIVRYDPQTRAVVSATPSRAVAKPDPALGQFYEALAKDMLTEAARP